jgi:hypothetical protein
MTIRIWSNPDMTSQPMTSGTNNKAYLAGESSATIGWQAGDQNNLTKTIQKYDQN